MYTQLTSVAWGSYLSSRNAKLLEKDFSKDYIIAEEGGSLVKHKVTVEQLEKMTDVWAIFITGDITWKKNLKF